MRKLLPVVVVVLVLVPLARLGKGQYYLPPTQAGIMPPGAGMQQASFQGAAPQSYPTDAGCHAGGACASGGCAGGGASVPDWQAFGAALCLHPRNAGVEYALPINGPIATGNVPLQMGTIGIVDPDYKVGFLVGATKALDKCSSLSFTYAYYANIATDSIGTNAPLVLQSMVMHPSSYDAANYWNSASAREYVGFQTGDVDYREQLYCDDCGSFTYLVGGRYANLRQDFNSNFESNISAAVGTSVNFDGGGLRVGLEGERHGCYGLFFYGKSAASFLGGMLRANYLQTNSTVNRPIADATWKEARLVPVLEGELGVGWAGAGGHLRAAIGYSIAGWLNMVKPADFIDSVQANSYHGAHALGQSDLVFDGFVSRVEFSW